MHNLILTHIIRGGQGRSFVNLQHPPGFLAGGSSNLVSEHSI